MLRQWRGEDLLRVKGILHLQEEALPVAIHGVHFRRKKFARCADR
jgi:hypothetical protein